MSPLNLDDDIVAMLDVLLGVVLPLVGILGLTVWFQRRFDKVHLALGECASELEWSRRHWTDHFTTLPPV
ncbi:MAG: hypothetical protein FJ087_12415 [Deltaproteobacteria bacterium]|nr:hypothetical protein [Deltaproteobacteria bacterium]